jgi:hypothetical protein
MQRIWRSHLFLTWENIFRNVNTAPLLTLRFLELWEDKLKVILIPNTSKTKWKQNIYYFPIQFQSKMYLVLNICNQLYSKIFSDFFSNSSLYLKFMTVDKRSNACLWKFSSIKSFTMILTCRLCSKVKQTFEQSKLQQWFLFVALLSICYKYIGVSNRDWSAFSLRFQN